MIKELSSPGLAKQYEALKQGLITWRSDPNKSMSIPKQLRNLAVATMEAGIPISKLQTLGLSHKQLKQWQALLGDARGEQLPTINFATVELQPATSLKPNTTAVVATTPAPLFSNADSNIKNTLNDFAATGDLTLQFKHPNGVSLEVLTSCVQDATKLIKEFIGA